MLVNVLKMFILIPLFTFTTIAIFAILWMKVIILFGHKYIKVYVKYVQLHHCNRIDGEKVLNRRKWRTKIGKYMTTYNNIVDGLVYYQKLNDTFCWWRPNNDERTSLPTREWPNVRTSSLKMTFKLDKNSAMNIAFYYKLLY